MKTSACLATPFPHVVGLSFFDRDVTAVVQEWETGHRRHVRGLAAGAGLYPLGLRSREDSS